MSRVIIIGGSIAGLVTARVLADHFDRVTVLDRDRFPGSPSFRAGTPQAHHIHVLLMKGQELLEGLFPGLQDELAAAGAPEMDWTADCLWFGLGKWGPRFPSGMITHFSSRPFLEYTVRRQLAQHPKIEFLEGHDVTGLTADAGASRITGVRFRLREAGAPDDATTLAADLVVDASGRESRMPEWLQALGYAPPAETCINSFLGYASRMYERPSMPAGWKAIIMRATPPANSRGGDLFPIEGNRWLANLNAARRDYPPTDEAGFLEFARSLPDPLLYNVLKDAKPISPINGYRRAENRLRHYERLLRLPENLVALGDSVCAFNPVYGQGMTVAVQGALALGRVLEEHGGADLTGLAKKYYRLLAKVNAIPWAMATSVDFVYPETVGGKPGRLSPLTNAYTRQVMELVFTSPRINLAFLQVLHLQKPPSSLFQPYILLQVARWMVLHGRGDPRGRPSDEGGRLSHGHPQGVPLPAQPQRNNYGRP